MSKDSIVVSNGIGRFHVYRAAQAAEQGDLLKYFLTSFCIKKEWQVRMLDNRLIRLIIGEERVEKGLLRQYPSIPYTKIRSFFLPELYFRTNVLLGKYYSRIPANTFRLFSKLSSSYVTDCRIFHVKSGFGNIALEKARESGAVCLVDHSASSPEFIKSVDEEIKKSWNTGWGKVSKHDPKLFLIAEDIKAADYILASSIFVKKNLETYHQILPSKIFVVPLGVDTKMFHPRSEIERKKDLFTVLFVGALSFRKGVPYLLEAFRRLKLSNAKLILVGAMCDAKELLRNYEGHFDYIPHLPYPWLVPLYQSASIFVFPSLSEGFGLVNCEAMASGLPVVTTYEAGSVVRDGIDGFVIPARDVDALMDRIHFLYEHRNMAHKMGLAARRNVCANYTWQHYADKVIHVYQTILSNSINSLQNNKSQ